MILLVGGTRPNFVKIAPIARELIKKNVKFKIVHTGQHYDFEMSKVFFDVLDLTNPNISIGVGSGTHAEQTGKIIKEFEKICIKEKPNLVIVVGDVNSTVACALVAAKLFIPIAHVEAGLRSFDRTMPEEINRVITDQLSDYLFTTCKDANINLENEGIPKSKIYFVGNVMIDTLMQFIEVSKKSEIMERLALRVDGNNRKYAVATLHRPINVDNAKIFKGILFALNKLSKYIPIIFPAHPRTRKMIEEFKLEGLISYGDNAALDLTNTNQALFVTPPMSYVDFLCMMSNATMVLTDSGGIQEETSVLGIPCLTLQSNTERPITTTEGTNFVVGNDPDKIFNTALKVLKCGFFRKNMPKYWDGNASERIVNILTNKI